MLQRLCLLLIFLSVSAIEAQVSIKTFSDLGLIARDNEDYNNRRSASELLRDSLVVLLSRPEHFRLSLDEIENLSVLYPPDSTFRLVTWQINEHEDAFRQYGLIQMPDGRVHVLQDASETMDNPEWLALDKNNWYGAIYYQIYPFKTPDKKQAYALFGLDSYRYWFKRKVMDLLYFSGGEPRFDLPLIVDDSLQTVWHRHIIEFSSTSAATIRYNPEEKMVVFDHITEMPGPASAGGVLLVADGTYEGYALHKGVWKHVNKLKVTEMSEAPRPMPVKSSGRDLFGKPRKS